MVFISALSNFESNFSDFLHSLRISRTQKQQLQSDGNSFLDFIKVRFPDQSSVSLQSIIRPQIIAEFSHWMEKKYRNKKRVRLITGLLEQFRLYVGRKSKIEKTEEALPKKTQELILTYLTSLTASDIPPVTVRNYKSDLMQFFTYLSLSQASSDIALQKEISLATRAGFSAYLADTLKLAPASVKRKMSALKSFLSWGQSQGYLLVEKEVSSFPIDPPIPPRTPIPPEIVFPQRYVHYPAVTSNKYIKYLPLCITILFLTSLASLAVMLKKNQQATPSAPLLTGVESKSPGRVLKYEGRLKTNNNEVSLTRQLARFRLWDQPTRGSLLYDSQNCAIQTDHNGIFSVQIGTDCGQLIPGDLLQSTRSVYLGVTIDQEQEMSPRQPVATVPYAANAQTVQGYSVQNPAGPSSIPYIDATGQLSLAATSPIVKSVAGTFTLEGRTMLLRSAPGSNGSITLSPDNIGTVNLLFTAPMTSQAPGFATIANPNILSGTLLHLSGSPLTSGYNLLELVSGNQSQSQFTVDAGGNTTIAGSLTAANSFTASSSGIVATAPLIVSDRIYDGGLGIFGTKGNTIPVEVDFTQPTRIEFDFKTDAQPFQTDVNISQDRIKFYRAYWTTEGTMGISQCTPTCQQLGSSPLIFGQGLWHHGYLSLTSDGIVWDIDNNAARVKVSLSKDVDLFQKGSVRFPSGAQALANLHFSQAKDTIITAGNGLIGGNVTTQGNILADGQIRPGSFSSAPSTAGSGAIYFNTSDNMLYFWNGSSWVSDTFWTRSGNSLYPNPSYSAALNIGIGTTSPLGKVNIADTTQEQLRLSYDADHYARFTASSSGVLAIDPTTDLLVAGNLNVGDGGLLYPSQNSTHQEQHSYFLTADTSGTGFIRTNAGGFQAGGSDFAERFRTTETLAPGDVVKLVRTPAGTSPLVGKSTQAYTGDVLGVVSDRAAFVGGVTDLSDKEKTAIVGLIGQIPVHVTTSNGPIHQGDPITTSLIPGVAMRATEKGPIIGRALADYTGEDGTVLTFVRPEWYDGSERGDIAGNLLTLPAGNSPAGADDLNVQKIAESLGSFFQSNVISAKEIIAESLTTITARIGSLTAENADLAHLRSATIETTDLGVKDITATGTATLAQIHTKTIKPLPNDLDITVQLPGSSSGFGRFLLTNDQQQTVAAIDAAGNASFSGSLVAQNGTVNTLQVHDSATIAGTLYADSIVSKDVQSLQTSFSTLLKNVNNLLSPTPAASPPAQPANIAQQQPASSSGAIAGVIQPTAAPSASSEIYQSDNSNTNNQPDFSDSLLADVDQHLTAARSLQERMELFLATSSAFLAQTQIPENGQSLKLSAPIDVPKNLSATTLSVIGNTTLADTAIAGQLFVDGNLLLEQHSITSLSDTLALSAKKAISLMGSTVMIDSSGNITTAGTVVAGGGIVTDSVKSYTGSINLDLSPKGSASVAPSGSATADSLGTTSVPDLLRTRIGSLDQPQTEGYGSVQIRGENQQTVTSIDANGNIHSKGTVEANTGRFSGTMSAGKLTVTTDIPASAGAEFISAEEHARQSGVNVPAIRTHDSAGSATIAAGTTQLYIYTDGITDKSLVYLTPTSSTQNRSLYVADKVAGSHIIVSLDSPITTDVRLNWWIIN